MASARCAWSEIDSRNAAALSSVGFVLFSATFSSSPFHPIYTFCADFEPASQKRPIRTGPPEVSGLRSHADPTIREATQLNVQAVRSATIGKKGPMKKVIHVTPTS